MRLSKRALLVAVLLLFTKTSRGAVSLLNEYGQQPIWPSMPISFWISAAGSSQINNGSEFPAVQAAFQTWQNVGTASVSFQYMGQTPVSTVGRDGLNVVTFADDSV